MAVHFETSNLFNENNVLLLIMVSHRVLTYYHLLPGLEFLEPGRVLPVPDDQTFKEMIQAKEEWQPRPRYIASSQSAYNSQQSEGLKIKDRPKQTSPLVQEPPPPLMVQEDTAEQYQALSLARGQDSKTENHGFGCTFIYHISQSMEDNESVSQVSKLSELLKFQKTSKKKTKKHIAGISHLS